MKLGQIGQLPGTAARPAAKQDYVNFYAYLHRVVDAPVGRMLAGARRPGDPGSLRSRKTVIARISDHGEMGLSHGGLRQKMFNVYEETIRVPLVVSNPVLFAGGEHRRTPASASLVDLVPTLLGIRRRAGDGDPRRAQPVRRARPPCTPDAAALSASAVDWSGVTAADAEVRRATTCCSPTTTIRPARRCRRSPGSRTGSAASATGAGSTPCTSTPTDGRPTEYELYDLDADPLEVRNLLGVRSGRAHEPRHEELRERMAAILERLCTDSGTLSPRLPT